MGLLHRVHVGTMSHLYGNGVNQDFGHYFRVADQPSGGRFVVSGAGESYNARAEGPKSGISLNQLHLNEPGTLRGRSYKLRVKIQFS